MEMMVPLKIIRKIKLVQLLLGIFLRIISEASYEEFQSGDNLETITPFWRMVNPNSKLVTEIEGNVVLIFIAERQTQENIIDVIQLSKIDFEGKLDVRLAKVSILIKTFFEQEQ